MPYPIRESLKALRSYVLAMKYERSDAEYMIIGKIVEKRKELLKLNDELKALEYLRNKGNEIINILEDVCKNPTDSQEHIESIIEPCRSVEKLLPARQQGIVIHKKPMKKHISYEMKLELITDDYHHASNIVRGNLFTSDGNKKPIMPNWTNGRKYDPCKGKMMKIRNELRKGPMSIRQISSYTGDALDTVKDFVKEMDKQGFFKNTLGLNSS